MRLFELRSSGDRPRLAFHPRVTVVRGLDEESVEHMKALLHDISAGVAPAWDGTMEVHGVLVPIGHLARLVGPAAGEPLIAPIEEVLPPVPGPPRGTGDQPEEVHARAVATREALEIATGDLVEELARIEREREGLEERMATASTRISQEAEAALELADGDLRDAAREAELDPYVTLADPDARVAHLHEVVGECDEVLSGLPVGDRAALAAATATLKAALAEGDVLSPDAAALAEIWVSLQARREGIQSRIDAANRDTETIAARLDEARVRARELKEACTPREITREEAERLERLHTQVVKLEARASTGVRRGSARKQLDEVHAELQTELDGLGYPTFFAYRMGNGYSTVDSARQEELEGAVTELQEAESEWGELTARLEADDELHDVVVAIEQVTRKIAEMLEIERSAVEAESPDVVAERLREQLVDAASLEVTVDEAVECLHAVMDDTGTHGHRDIQDAEACLGLGESWLDVLTAAELAAVRVLRDRGRAEAELTAIEEVAPRAGADLLADARSAVVDAEDEVSELRRGLVSVATLRREIHDLMTAEQVAAEDHEAKKELLEAARALEELAESRLPSNNRPATARRGITALVPRGLGGPVPMIVELGDVDDVSLEQLVSVPDDVQVIALGGGEGVVGWVESLGPTYATLVDVGARV